MWGDKVEDGKRVKGGETGCRCFSNYGGQINIFSIVDYIAFHYSVNCCLLSPCYIFYKETESDNWRAIQNIYLVFSCKTSKNQG